MLGGVPGGALEELVHWWGAVECFYRLAAGFIVKLAPPGLKLFNDAVAVGCYFFSLGAGTVFGWDVGVVGFVFDVVDRGFEESFADAEDVVV